MAPKLYTMDLSPVARGVAITAAALGLELERQYVDLFKKEQFNPDFLQLNPQHTIPTLVHGDYVLWDSHAITPYLADRYGTDDSLYPKDLQKRGTVNQRLHLNNTVVRVVLCGTSRPVFFGEAKTVPNEKKEEANEIYALLNTLLDKARYIADNNVTIADFNFVASLSSLKIWVPIEEAKYPRLTKWYKEITALPCYQANIPGLQQYEALAKSKLESLIECK